MATIEDWMIYLVRHGETEWNVASRYQGAKDSRLTARGQTQARAAGARLRTLVGSDIPLQAAVSPLGRARETADLISYELPLVQKIESRIAEVSIGSWDGLTDYEIEAEHPGALEGSTHFDWFFRSPDGETFESAVARVEAWLDEVKPPVLAVSHGLTGRLIRGTYLGLTPHEMLRLPVPQDGIFLLQDGTVQFVGS